MGGRLILLKSVLSSIPIYFLFFFKAPSGIISSIESIFNAFFWGGCEDIRKITWIKWDTVCLRKQEGGLGVMRLKEFNLALLGKWWWWILHERGSLWYRVLCARYGEEGGQLCSLGGEEGLVWWRSILSVREGVGQVDSGWLLDNITGQVEDGESTLFWIDPWLDGEPLCKAFVRLFELSENKLETVVNMMGRGWCAGGEAWRWRRRLFAWEELLLGESVARLTSVTLQVGRVDKWSWSLHTSNCYTVSSTYSFLTETDIRQEQINNNNFIWLKAVPLKVSIFAWCLFLNRLPTRDKLFQRRVLADSDQRCHANCGLNEDKDHLFLNCGFFWRYLAAYCGLVRILNNFAWFFSVSLPSVWRVAWLFDKIN